MASKSNSRRSARLIFAQNVRRLRLELGWSQEELADKVGLHRTYVGSVERGERNVSIDNVEKMARALGRTVADMFLEGGA